MQEFPKRPIGHRWKTRQSIWVRVLPLFHCRATVIASLFWLLACTNDQESRSLELLTLVILHQGRMHTFFGKRLCAVARDLHDRSSFIQVRRCCIPLSLLSSALTRITDVVNNIVAPPPPAMTSSFANKKHVRHDSSVILMCLLVAPCCCLCWCCLVQLVC